MSRLIPIKSSKRKIDFASEVEDAKASIKKRKTVSIWNNLPKDMLFLLANTMSYGNVLELKKVWNEVDDQKIKYLVDKVDRDLFCFNVGRIDFSYLEKIEIRLPTPYFISLLFAAFTRKGVSNLKSFIFFLYERDDWGLPLLDQILQKSADLEELSLQLRFTPNSSQFGWMKTLKKVRELDFSVNGSDVFLLRSLFGFIESISNWISIYLKGFTFSRVTSLFFKLVDEFKKNSDTLEDLYLRDMALFDVDMDHLINTLPSLTNLMRLTLATNLTFEKKAQVCAKVILLPKLKEVWFRDDVDLVEMIHKVSSGTPKTMIIVF